MLSTPPSTPGTTAPEPKSLTDFERFAAPQGPVLLRSRWLVATGVRHAFTTRRGGVSGGAYESLDLGHSTCGLTATAPAGGDQSAVAENYRRVIAALGCVGRKHAWAHQVHGRAVFEVSDANSDMHPHADGLVTASAGIVISIRVADCVPVLLADRRRRCIGAVHAGWRGIAANVVAATIEAMRQTHGIAPSDLVAALGPCIGVEHFEVGEEVAAALADAGLADAVRGPATPGRKFHADLHAAAELQLRRAGVQEIDNPRLCTYADAGDFFSHRRDRGVTGRMAALIAL